MRKLLFAQLVAAIVLACATVQDAPAQPGVQPPAAAKDLTKIAVIVEAVSGEVQFRRENRWQNVTKESQLTQGDTILVNIGAILKLEFQHPTSGVVLAATILRGLTEMTIAEAYLQGAQSRTQLDVNQGLIRAGVVKTAVPPSFQVRTPRQVVGVRGTEIAELEVTPMGDSIRMGRVGTVLAQDGVPLFRSARAGQGSEKRAEGNRRDDTLLRAIEFAVLDARVALTGPHRRQFEVDYDRQSYDLVELNGGEQWKAEGNVRYEMWIGGQGVLGGSQCPECPRGQPGRKR